MKTLQKLIGLQKFTLFGTHRLVFEVITPGGGEVPEQETMEEMQQRLEELQTEFTKTNHQIKKAKIVDQITELRDKIADAIERLKKAVDTALRNVHEIDAESYTDKLKQVEEQMKVSSTSTTQKNTRTLLHLKIAKEALEKLIAAEERLASELEVNEEASSEITGVADETGGKITETVKPLTGFTAKLGDMFENDKGEKFALIEEMGQIYISNSSEDLKLLMNDQNSLDNYLEKFGLKPVQKENEEIDLEEIIINDENDFLIDESDFAAGVVINSEENSIEDQDEEESDVDVLPEEEIDNSELSVSAGEVFDSTKGPNAGTKFALKNNKKGDGLVLVDLDDKRNFAYIRQQSDFERVQDLLGLEFLIEGIDSIIEDEDLLDKSEKIIEDVFSIVENIRKKIEDNDIALDEGEQLIEENIVRIENNISRLQDYFLQIKGMVEFLQKDETVQESKELSERVSDIINVTNGHREDFKIQLDRYFCKKDLFLDTDEKHTKIRATIDEAEQVNVEIGNDNVRLEKSINSWEETVSEYIDTNDKSAEGLTDDLGKLKKDKVRLKSLLNRVQAELAIDKDFVFVGEHGNEIPGIEYEEQVQGQITRIQKREQEVAEKVDEYDNRLLELKQLLRGEEIKDIHPSLKSEEDVAKDLKEELQREKNNSNKKWIGHRLVDWISKILQERNISK